MSADKSASNGSSSAASGASAAAAWNSSDEYRELLFGQAYVGACCMHSICEDVQHGPTPDTSALSQSPYSSKPEQAK